MSAGHCPGCGLALGPEKQPLDDDYNASMSCRGLYDELSAFTLSLRDEDFIHQLVVDAYAAQHVGRNAKPIRTVFALIGLHLTFERGFTGKQVQRAHMMLGRVRRVWPRFGAPSETGGLTVLDVVRGLNEENHKERINAWGKSVWSAWSTEHDNVRELVEKYLDGR